MWTILVRVMLVWLIFILNLLVFSWYRVLIPCLLFTGLDDSINHFRRQSESLSLQLEHRLSISA